MTRSPGIQLAVAVGVLLALAVACMPRKPSESDIVGSWVETSQTASGETEECATITFLADGQFEAAQLPEEYFRMSGFGHPARVDTFGTWKLGKSINGTPSVTLQFDPNPYSWYPSGYISDLLVATQRNGFKLYHWVGDGSNRITFVKTDVADCSAE